MITYQLFEVGHCLHCERMTLQTGKLKLVQYPALCALIHHPKYGYILFDTGYSERFQEATQHFPESLYRFLTPVTVHQPLRAQLLNINIKPEQINYIIVSHFHADHIGGSHDFPRATFIVHTQALEDIEQKKGLKALLAGFLPALLPDNFKKRTRALYQHTTLPKKLMPFTKGFDIFGDQTLFAVPLPGHAKGQIGLYVEAKQPVFFIADSCWHQETFQSLILPSKLTHLILDDKKAYYETIKKLHQLHQHDPMLDIIPSHCQQARQKIFTSC